MQAADNVEFRGAFGNAFRGARENFVERKSVSTRRIGRTPESAQLAVRHADIRRIDVPVDVEVADIAVALLAHVIREPADRQQVVRLEEREAVIGREALARQDFLSDGLEARVHDL